MPQVEIAVRRQIGRTERDGERGATLIEYALLLVLIAVVCVAAVTMLGNNSSSSLSKGAVSDSSAGSGSTTTTTAAAGPNGGQALAAWENDCQGQGGEPEITGSSGGLTFYDCPSRFGGVGNLGTFTYDPSQS